MANATIPYIIAEDGFYYVAYKEKAKVPEIVVSAKGVANGLSDEYNDGWDFGPDSYSPTSTSAIPYTESTGIGEALQYAISNPTYAKTTGSFTGYFLPEVRLLSGYFTITKPIVLNVPYRIMNLTLKGVDAMSPYISCAFNTTSSDKYPYAININASDVSNITYIDIQWEHMQPQVASGYTPYGFVNFDFSSVNTSQNTFIGYDLDVSNSGFTSAFNLLGFQQIHMYDFENYGSGNNFNAGFIDFHGGYNASGYIGVSGGDIFSFGMGIHPPTPVGDTSYLGIFGSAHASLGIYNPNISQTFTIGTLFYGYGSGLGISDFSLFNNASSGTITINQLIVRGITASGLTESKRLIDGNGATTSIGMTDVEGLYSTNEYTWFNNFPNVPTTPSVPASGTAQQNTEPYAVKVYVNGGAVMPLSIS